MDFFLLALSTGGMAVSGMLACPPAFPGASARRQPSSSTPTQRKEQFLSNVALSCSIAPAGRDHRAPVEPCISSRFSSQG